MLLEKDARLFFQVFLLVHLVLLGRISGGDAVVLSSQELFVGLERLIFLIIPSTWQN